jgi:ribosome-binding factor A
MKKQRISKGPSQRQLRVGEQIRHMVAQTLQRGHFHHEALMDTAAGVSVTEVTVSPDLKHATAYVMSLGGENIESVLEALNDVAPYFQKEINLNSSLKFTPRLIFKKDSSFDEARKIDEILSKLKN